MNGLMPVMAKEIYRTDQTGLGYLVASSASGAVLGAIVLSRIGHVIRPARMLIVFSAAWYIALMAFAHTAHPTVGIPLLLLAGLSQAMSQIPMAAMLLRNSDEQLRGRVMGIRSLAIYGNVPGLLLSGWLIARVGYPGTATLYCVLGLAFTLFVAARWRAQLWRRDAPANQR